MKRLIVVALLAGLALPSAGWSVELKNYRLSYGPKGATRFDSKFLPGDILFMSYDIDGLVLGIKKKASYVTTLELIDPQGKKTKLSETPNEAFPELGGASMPGDLHIILAGKQLAGQYTARLTVQDLLGKDTKSLDYRFEVLPEVLGFTLVKAPPFAVPGQYHATGFALANLTLQGPKGNRFPKAEVTIKVIDQKGLGPADVKMFLPADMPSGFNLEESNVVPLSYPVMCNRPGRFTMEITAVDTLAKKETKLRYTFTVLDIASFTGK